MLSRYHLGARFRLKLLLHFARPTADDVVIDAGCGDGYATYRVSRIAAKVYGVDISKQAIRQNKKDYKQQNLTFIVADLNTLSTRFSKNPASLIVCLDVLEHAENFAGIIKSFSDSLCPGGRLFITLPTEEGHGHLDVKDPKSIKKIIEAQGFKVAVIKTVGYSLLRKTFAFLVDGARNAMGFRMDDVDDFSDTLSYRMENRGGALLGAYKAGMTVVNGLLALDPQQYGKGDKELVIVAKKK
ncbi:MAG: methyltransferase domain-containing protein [Nanoarchaeota archaeon]